MVLRIELVREGDGVAADYINDGGAPIALTFWWNRSMRVVDAAGVVAKPSGGPVLPCGVGEDWQVLAPGETVRPNEPMLCTRPAGRTEAIGWSYEELAAGSYTVVLVYESPAPHGFTQSRPRPQAFVGRVESSAVIVDIVEKPKKKGFIARL